MRLYHLICPFLAAAAAFAQTLPQGVVKKASVGGITEYQYPNGLRVLLYPNPANPKLTINVTYLVGSRHEATANRAWRTCSSIINFIETTNGRKIKDEIVATRPAGTAPPPTTAPTTTKPSPRPTTI
jgi:zinc protease